jgi:hypothetical protein
MILRSPITAIKSLFSDDIEISKVDPVLELTDTVVGNSARLTRIASNNRMSLLNTVTKPGGFSNALSFGGSPEHAIGAAVSGSQTGTMMFWINSTDSGSYTVVFGSADEAASAKYLMVGVNPSGYVFVQSAVGAGASRVRGSLYAVNDGSFHLCIVKSNGSSWDIKIDDQPESLVIDAGSNNGNWFGDISSRDNSTIGALKTSSLGFFLIATIDHLALWNDVTSSNDDSNLWNGGSGLDFTKTTIWPTDGGSMGSNLELLCPMNQNTGTNVPDISDNGNDFITIDMSDPWVTGHVPLAGSDNENNVISAQNGADPSQGYIIKIGDSLNPGEVIIIGNEHNWKQNGVPVMSLVANGNLGLGTSNFGTNAAGVFGLGISTPPTSSPADMVTQYAEKVSGFAELHVRDEAGNVTVLSPHPIGFLNSLPVDADHEVPFAYHSRNEYLGKEIFIDLELLAREVQRLSGKTLIYVNEISKKNWDDNQARNEEKYLETAKKTEMEKEHEVSIDDALEEVAIEEKVQVGTSLEYKLNQDGIIEEIQVSRYENKPTGQTKKQLKSRVRFDKRTGKFYKKHTADEINERIAAGTIAIEPFNAKQAPDWIKNRLK